MDRDLFWKAAGIFDGTTMTFGDETFDLRGIRDAIRRVEERTAPALHERLALKMSGIVISEVGKIDEPPPS